MREGVGGGGGGREKVGCVGRGRRQVSLCGESETLETVGRGLQER